MSKHAKTVITKVVIAVIIIAAVIAGAWLWHTSQMQSLAEQLTDEQAQEARMSARVKAIQAQLDSTETENETLLSQIDDLLTEEVAAFDAAMLSEEIEEIGVLETVEYRYTNVGTLDAADTLKLTGWTLPWSKKSAVVSMDGVIKAGVDLTKVQITTDEDAKTITVIVPNAEITSDELDEDSLTVYVEKETVFSNLTLEDGSSLRTQIKTEAEANFLDNGLLTQAHRKACELVRWMIEAVPEAAENYTITVY